VGNTNIILVGTNEFTYNHVQKSKVMVTSLSWKHH